MGSTITRCADLVNGALPNGTAVHATILTYPFTSETLDVPPANRPIILANVSDFIQPFSSSAFTVTEAALGDPSSRSLIRKFTAAMYSANRYLDSQSYCSIKAIAKQLNVSITVATSAYQSATNPMNGETYPRDVFAVNRQGLLNVIDVRNQFGGFNKSLQSFDFADAILPGPGKLIDYSVLIEALNSLIRYCPGQC